LVKVRANGEGFITDSVWTTTFMQNKFNSSVLVDGVVYGLHDGVLAAQDVETGASLWEGERYGHGQILYADGRLIVLAEDGTLMLHEVSRDGVQPRGRVEALRGRTWAVPALAGGRLLIRNEREMVVYDLRARGDASVE
jgi:outer membrane protein assembly factor BamB